MSTNQKNTLTPEDILESELPVVVLVARLEPIAGLDRFQPAGFPEVGHVFYKAPRVVKDGDKERLWEENVCIVDSAASMANHLESVCMRGPHDYELVDELQGMPYLRCVTGDAQNGKLPLDRREVVVTSLTEGHRIASTYFLQGQIINSRDELEETEKNVGKGKTEKERKRLESVLIEKFGIVLPGSKQAHPPVEKWWDIFSTIFQYDPNALVHGVLFPQWQIKIPRMLTAHLEAFGAGRVDRSGVKFDRLGKTTSGQPIFAVDDATAQEIRATFILDIALVRSFGRTKGDQTLGLNDAQKKFLVALALWKIRRLLERPFRFRSGCHLECVSLKRRDQEIEISVNIEEARKNAGFGNPPITDVYWPREELYREGGAPEGDRSEDSEEGKEEQSDDGGEPE